MFGELKSHLGSSLSHLGSHLGSRSKIPPGIPSGIPLGIPPGIPGGIPTNILHGKCHAIRDAQLIEKVEIKKEQLDEEKRLDEMMEVERCKALNEYEEREKVAHFERLKGAQVLQQQITDRVQLRLLDGEKKDQRMQMNMIFVRLCYGRESGREWNDTST